MFENITLSLSVLRLLHKNISLKWYGTQSVTPRSQNRPKISFLEKYASATPGGINGPYPEPEFVLHNNRWDQKLPKISA